MAPDFAATAKQREEEEKQLVARVVVITERIINVSDFNHNPDSQASTGFSQLS